MKSFRLFSLGLLLLNLLSFSAYSQEKPAAPVSGIWRRVLPTSFESVPGEDKALYPKTFKDMEWEEEDLGDFFYFIDFKPEGSCTAIGFGVFGGLSVIESQFFWLLEDGGKTLKLFGGVPTKKMIFFDIKKRSDTLMIWRNKEDEPGSLLYFVPSDEQSLTEAKKKWKILEGEVWAEQEELIVEEEELVMVTLANYDAYVPGSHLKDFENYINLGLQSDKKLKPLRTVKKVLVQFTVGQDGRLSNALILEGIDKKYDEKIKELIEGSSGWSPAMKDGLPIKSEQSMYLDILPGI